MEDETRIAFRWLTTAQREQEVCHVDIGTALVIRSVALRFAHDMGIEILQAKEGLRQKLHDASFDAG